jgi:hypothetical protein
MYFADRQGHTIRQINLFQEEVETLIGTQATIEPIDGNKTVARLDGPIAVPLGEGGDDAFVFSVSQIDNVVRHVFGDGEIETVAGVRGIEGLPVDGPEGVGTLGFIYDAVRIGSDLYACDAFAFAGAIRRINAGGTITTVAGTIGEEGFVDGFGAAARFSFGETGCGLATDGTDLFIADAGNFAIRRFDVSTGEVTTFAGGTEGTANGTGTDAQFLMPLGLAFDGDVLYVADSVDCVIRQIDVATAEVTNLIGLSGTAGEVDGDASEATLNFPFRLAADGIGNLYVTGFPQTSRIIRRISIDEPEISLFAGDSTKSGVATGALPTTVNCPLGMSIDDAGDLIVADYCDDAILAIRPL